MTQIGPALDLAQVTEYAEDAAWHLIFDADIHMDIEYDPNSGRIMITADLAAVPHQREKIFETLLHYNYFWTERGAAKFSGAYRSPAGHPRFRCDRTRRDRATNKHQRTHPGLNFQRRKTCLT